MRRIWLVFAQATTIAVALLFVVSTFRPEWLPSGAAGRPTEVVVRESLLPASTRQAAADRTDSYHAAVLRATPSVVNIFTSKEVRAQLGPFFFDDPATRRFFGGESRRVTNLGSGVVVGENGFIVTNHHVVESADEIEVALPNGRRLLARVVGNDPDTDLAVLRVDADKLAAISFGAAESPRVGDVVLAIGNPFGVGQTVTAGIVSALGRSGLHINTFENFIQTDAAINPGNSGGALIDTQGNLLGINTAIYSRSGGSQGIGFAIPSSTVKMVLEQIVRNGTVTRGWIGVEAQEITAEIAESYRLPDTRGAIIAGVLGGGPADKAGARPGDVLREIDGRPVADTAGMLNLVAALAPGNTARLTVLRKGESVDLNVQVGRRPKAPNRGARAPNE